MWRPMSLKDVATHEHEGCDGTFNCQSGVAYAPALPAGATRQSRFELIGVAYAPMLPECCCAYVALNS